MWEIYSARSSLETVDFEYREIKWNFHKHVVIGVTAISDEEDVLCGLISYAHTCHQDSSSTMELGNLNSLHNEGVGKSAQIHWFELASPPPRWSYEWDAWVRALLPCSHIKALQGSKCFKSATSRQRQFYAAKGFRMSASWIENDWNHQVNEISKENESSGSKLSRQLIATLIRSGRDRHQHFPEIHREQIS